MAVGSLALSTCQLRANDPNIDRPDFNRHVRPILSTHCYKCHGPDEKTREAGLRLDDFEAATADLGGYSAIEVGNPDGSEIIARILSDDPDVVMPPPSTNKTISPAELKTLKAWISSGAKYEPHWSFVQPTKTPLPAVSDKDWCRNPIDRFVLAKLDATDLAPSEVADRRTLVRRVFLDLVGLPPTPEEADAFLNDTSPDAYEQLVDRLLASPHYGERWGRRWLDIARYADTNGYEKDRPRSIWPYRDWVIEALNDGMPYDEFIVKQLAGDMLPAENAERMNNLIATGFHRNTMVNEEGGADPLEYRFHAMVDRTNTTGTALFGLTVGCTQCHTHKYDPITHTEYYGLMAFLNNADEPVLELPDADVEQARADQLARADRMASRRLTEWRFQAVRNAPTEDSEGGPTAKSAQQQPAGDARESSETLSVDIQPATEPANDAMVDAAFAEWIAANRTSMADWQVVVPHRRSANLARFDEMPDKSLFAQGDVSKEDTYELAVAAPAGTTAIRLEALPDERLPSNGPGRAYYEGPSGDFMLSDIKIVKNDQPLAIAEATATYVGTGFGKQAPVTGAIDDDKHTGWSIGGRPGERHVAVFVLEEPLDEAADIDLQMLFFRHFAAPLGRFRLSVTDAPTPGATILKDDVQRTLLASQESWSDDDRETVKQAWLSVAPELVKYNEQIANLRRNLPTAVTTLVMRERPANHSRQTRRHHRGEYVSPEEIVEPTVPSAIGEWPEDRPRTRLAFARWAMSNANPLAARVKVNRDWEAIFGVGLVRTLDDFGSQGEMPSHPQLLDWMAVEFVEAGWDTKALHKLIVMSSTYRQSSSASANAIKIDPENRLLSHGARKRLDAEFIRDAILTASNLLTRTIGGPSVYPPQPDVVAKENFYAKFEWNTETGPNRYRRGLYTFAKRTNPYAMFNTFDGPTGTVCVARRERSNTPLQALTMLNDTVIVEAARKFGTDAAAHEGDSNEIATWLFRRCLVRPPSAFEQKSLVEFYTAQLNDLVDNPKQVNDLMQSEDASPNAAAWMLVARALLNTDEMIVNR